MKRSGDLPMVKQPGRGRTRTQSPAHPTPEPVLRGNNGVRAHLEEGGSESPEELRPGMVGLTLQVVKTSQIFCNHIYIYLPMYLSARINH